MSAHRFWQVYVPPEGRGSNGSIQIGELNLRSSIGVNPTYPSPGLNPFSASSYLYTYTPDKAFDGDNATFWSAQQGSGSADIRCDFGSPVDVVEVAITVASTGNYQYQPVKFYLRYSDDDIHYVNYYVSPTVVWSAAETKAFLVSSGLLGDGNLFLSPLVNPLYPLTDKREALFFLAYDYDDKTPFCSKKGVGGLFGIQGTTTSLGAPTAKRVDLLEQSSGIIIGTRNTGADGAFRFNHIDEGLYTVMGVDNTGNQNSVVFAHVVSEIL